ncbi:MAG: FlgD immunoglobulin-like domain containing protein [Candidatus Zixiibacteriota bacterium]
MRIPKFTDSMFSGKKNATLIAVMLMMLVAGLAYASNPNAAEQQINTSDPASQNSTVILMVSYENNKTTIYSSSTVDIVALQFEFDGQLTSNPDKIITDRMDLLCGSKNDKIQVGLLDLKGKARISAGEHAVFSLAGKHALLSAVAVDAEKNTIEPEIINQTGLLLPDEFSFEQNYPNPFNPSTTFSFSLPAETMVNLAIYNILGQHVTSVVDEVLSVGPHKVTWDGNDSDGNTAASGIYYARLKAGESVKSIKIMLVK